MNWITFYAPTMWTLGFWEWGADYTIVKNRHVGLDIGTNRRAVNVPCLYSGRVVIVTKTRSMGWVVVLDTGLPGNRRYHAYCHLSAENLPRAGVTIGRNSRVGRLAAGPKGVSYANVDYPGTAWGGIHLHLVMCDIAYGAYTLNTGASFGNPETFIREQLAGSAAGGDSRPFDPEENDMYDNDPALRARLDQIVGFISDNFTGLTGKVAGEADQTRKHVDRRVNDLAGWTRDDAVATRNAIGALSAAGTDPAKIAAAIAPLIPRGASAKDVADELAKRLAG